MFADNPYRSLFASVVLGEAAGKRYTTLFTPRQRSTRKLKTVSTHLSIKRSEFQDAQLSNINQAKVDKL